ncbi:MAG: restriction endonuclease [Candidatus Portnoybacteria bacterium]|nr:restriction endonuclease [Candidatus Portnoybacteria bacterium]
MKIIAMFSFNKGLKYIEEHHKDELLEVRRIVRLIKAESYKTKKSKEKTMRGKRLYAPKKLNKEFEELLKNRGWKIGVRIIMETKIPELKKIHKGFREMDAVKNRLGVEVQFGKYSFMVYNVSAKMSIFANRGIIDSGIEIVPMKSLAQEMSTGVSYFEQIKSDLEARGVSNIDIPVLILGIDA